MGSPFANHLIFAVLVQCLFSIVYLSTWQWQRNKWLVVNFVVIFLLQAGFYFGGEKLTLGQKIFIGNPGFMLAVMPSFFLFTKELVSIPIQKQRIALHFLPAFIFYVLFLFFDTIHPTEFMRQSSGGNFPMVHLAHFIMVVLVTFFYGSAIFRLLKFNAQKFKNEYAHADIYLTLDWLKYLCWVVLSFIFLGILQVIFSPFIQNISLSFEVIAALFLATTMAVSYFAFRQPTLYPQTEIATENSPESTSEVTQKPLLNEEKIKALSVQLNTYLSEEKPFLQEDIRLPQVAAALNLSRNELSWFLNEQLNVNFFAFINQHRVEYAADLLKKEDYAHYTLEAISKMAGFRSKTTFNSRFKEVFGMTPSVYRREKS